MEYTLRPFQIRKLQKMTIEEREALLQDLEDKRGEAGCNWDMEKSDYYGRLIQATKKYIEEVL